ncbi:MAG: winged helix-turn-helix transcriptional regulator [Methanolinea sp.]|nr:winged helix-turn-helix transcriptional regulator [Methanolinea sp.]
MTEASKDPLSSLLRSKREVTRLQILVEIAEHQPAVRQQEIAGKLGVTPQAVSEYIRELVDEEMVAAHGRGHYSVTRSGIEWIISHAEALETYARHIRRDIIQQVSTWTAIAAEDLSEGEQVGVYMEHGWLYASREPRSAMGSVVTDARAGEDVGVTRLSGLIDHTEGVLHVCKVPRIQRGGSRKVRRDRLLEVIKGVGVVAAVGLEGYIALQQAGKTPDMFFGAREGVIEAAFHGIDCAILIVDEEFTDFLKRLEGVGLTYILHDLIAP